MPQVSASGTWNLSRTGPTTSANASPVTSAKPTTQVVQWCSVRPPAFARTWNTVRKPTIVATSMR